MRIAVPVVSGEVFSPLANAGRVVERKSELIQPNLPSTLTNVHPSCLAAACTSLPSDTVVTLS